MQFHFHVFCATGIWAVLSWEGAMGLCGKEWISCRLCSAASHPDSLPAREEALNSWSWPEDGNSILHPLLKFQISHFFCNRTKVSWLLSQSSTCLSFGNKTRASWVLSLRPTFRRVSSTFSLVARAWNTCLWFLALLCSEQFSISVLSDWGSAQIWAWASYTASRFPVTWLRHSEVSFPVDREFLKISGKTPTSTWDKNGLSSKLINETH